MMWPLLVRLFGDLEDYLMEQLFLLGDTKFLRQWPCRFFRMTGIYVVLRLGDWSSMEACISATFRQFGEACVGICL